MAWTNWGFDGTINEAQWSQMAGLLGNGYVAANSASCVVTAVSGARSVSVSEGTLYGDGVVSVNVGADTVAMTTPVNGQWFVIALRRTWATNTAATVAIAGATTTTTTPTAPPSTLPTLNANPGVLSDQPIAWAWCNSANTTVVVYDMRQFPVRSMPVTVANNVVRDGIFQTPTQGQQVWRNDLGAVETYYGAYNAISNPGGRDVAGWYVDGRAGGLVPLRAGTVTIVSGTGSTNSMGQINFSNATNIHVDNVFSSNYRNYKIIIDPNSSSANSTIQMRIRKNGTSYTGAQYNFGGVAARSTGTQTAFVGASQQQWSLAWINGPAAGAGSTAISLDIYGPHLHPFQKIVVTSTGTDGTSLAGTFIGGTCFSNQDANDGFTIMSASGTFSGSIQIFGYND